MCAAARGRCAVDAPKRAHLYSMAGILASMGFAGCRPNTGVFLARIGLRFLAFVTVLLALSLSGAFAGSAAASEGDEPAQPASFATWHTDNFFTQCDGNCAVSVFGGPQLLTHQYNILVHLTPPWEWRFGNADLIGGAISRRLLTLWDSLDIESEF